MITYLLDARTVTGHFPGIGRYVSNLARAMVPLLHAHERLLLLMQTSQVSPWPLPREHENVQRVELAASPFSFRQQWLVPRAAKHHDVTLYHSPYYLMPYVMPVPTVLTVYDLIPQLFPKYVSPRARLVFHTATWFALRRASHVITISQSARRDLLRHHAVAEERLTAIPLAPDPRFRPATSQQVADVQKRLQIPRRYVLYLGSNKPHKNLGALLRAWKQLLEEEDESHARPLFLVIAGIWDERYGQPRQMVDTLQVEDSVRFIGPVHEDDLPALYSGAMAFVFPSLYEGFGLPVVEAMACGAAVACADRASLPEIAGDAALLFDPSHIPAIVSALRRLLYDQQLRHELKQRGPAQAARFSWQRTAQRTLDCYRRVLRMPGE